MLCQFPLIRRDLAESSAQRCHQSWDLTESYVHLPNSLISMPMVVEWRPLTPTSFWKFPAGDPFYTPQIVSSGQEENSCYFFPFLWPQDLFFRGLLIQSDPPRKLFLFLCVVEWSVAIVWFGLQTTQIYLPHSFCGSKIWIQVSWVLCSGVTRLK